MAAVLPGLPCRVVVWLADIRPGRNVVVTAPEYVAPLRVRDRSWV